MPDKENIRQMVDMKANKKIIQATVMQSTGKVVLMKDIHNLKNPKPKSNDMTTLQSAVNELQKTNGAYVKLQTSNKSENPELTGLFFQDERMRQVFAEYPEFLCVDATYKVNDLRMPLYLLIVENGNGQSEIVGVWIVANESADTIREMVDIFKEQNPKWTEIKTVMTDKDFVERDVFSNSFPDAKLRICLFHVLRTFRREVTAEKMGVTKLQRDSLLETLQKIAYSRNVDEYETNKKMLLDKKISAAENYFMNSWDSIKNEWVVGLFESESLGNKTNNRVESINQKIKQVIDRNAKFDTFATDLVNFLNMHRTEINGKLCRSVNKVPTKSATDGVPESQYRRVLTSFAFSLVEQQMKKSDTVQVTETWDKYSCTSGGLEYDTTETTCTCDFRRQYKLPCKHIFAVRKKQEVELFSQELIESRWTKAKYLGILNQTVTGNQVHTSETTSVRKPTSQQDRFRMSFRVAQRLASVASESTGAGFDVKIKQLETLSSAWEKGQNVVIETVDNEPQNTDNINTDDPEPITTATNNRTVGEQEATIESVMNEQESAIESALNDVVQVNDNELLSTETGSDTNDDIVRPENNVLGAVEEANESPTADAADTMNQTTDVANILMQLAAGGSESELDLRLELSRDDTEDTALVAIPATQSAGEFIDDRASSIDIANISLPPRIQKRGRPKGSELTVIGLPKKRLKLQKPKCTAFERMNNSQKESFILSWFVDKRVIDKCMTEHHKIQEDEVEVNPDNIPLACKEVQVDIVKQYFSEDAWAALIQCVTIRQSHEWTCNVCSEELETRAVCCDRCLLWHHFHCASISAKPKTKYWYCQSCRAESDS